MMSHARTWAVLAMTLAASLTPSAALAGEPTVPTLANAGSAVPSVGGDVEGEPNLLDLEFVTGRVTFKSPSKVLTTLTMAPLLSPNYDWRYAETRIGVYAETSGAFGMGVAWGYNGARNRLAHSTVPTLAEIESPEEAAKRQKKLADVSDDLDVAVKSACAIVAECAAAPVSDNCSRLTRGAAGRPSALRICRSDAGRTVRARQLVSALDLQASATPDQTYRAIGELRSRIRDLIDEFASGALTSAQKADDALLKKQQQKRLAEAYKGSWGVNVLGVVGFFPPVNAPPIVTATSTTPVNVYDQVLRNVDASLAVRYYFTRYILAQLRGGNRFDRADASSSTSLDGRGYGAIDVGLFAPLVSAPDDSGFERGIGFGFTTIVYGCEVSAGCSTDPGLGDPYPKTVPLEWRAQMTMFVEIRLLKELQFRVGADYIVDQVHGPIKGVAAAYDAPRLAHLVPSISAGSSFWGL